MSLLEQLEVRRNFENEKDRCIISSLLRENKKLKRLITILSGATVVCLVVSVLIATFLIDKTKNNIHDKSRINQLTDEISLACWSSPCFNGGQCLDTSDYGYNCSCPVGFSGPRCLESQCDDIICENGGLCQVNGDNYSCICQFGYFGDKCQYDPCKKEPCQYKGICHTYPPDYRCSCPENFSGKNCQETPCDRVTCQNGGECVIIKNRYKCKCTADYVGHLCQEKGYKDYLLMFTEPPSQESIAFLLIIVGRSAKLNIDALGDGMKRTYELIADSRNEINLSNSFFTKDRLIEAKGIRVTSNVALKVIGYVKNGGGDGFLATPTKFLGTEYAVMIYKLNKSKYVHKPVFGIVSKDNNNKINITVKSQNNSALLFNSKSYKTGDVIQLTLQELGSFQLSHTSDLSGTIIRSDKPIAVISGNTCALSLTYYCNTILEMMLPVTQADYIFIIPTVEAREQFFVRIYCIHDTSIVITVNGLNHFYDMQNGEFLEYRSQDMSIINASRPVNVYGVPSDTQLYDAYMTSFYGTRQWKSDFLFVRAVSEEMDYISVVFQGPVDDAYGFILDGELISPVRENIFSENVNGTSFVTFTHPIYFPFNNIHHTSNMTFGVWVHGKEEYFGYGYPADIGYFNV